MLSTKFCGGGGGRTTFFLAGLTLAACLPGLMRTPPGKLCVVRRTLETGTAVLLLRIATGEPGIPPITGIGAIAIAEEVVNGRSGTRNEAISANANVDLLFRVISLLVSGCRSGVVTENADGAYVLGLLSFLKNRSQP